MAAAVPPDPDRGDQRRQGEKSDPQDPDDRIVEKLVKGYPGHEETEGEAQIGKQGPFVGQDRPVGRQVIGDPLEAKKPGRDIILHRSSDGDSRPKIS